MMPWGWLTWRERLKALGLCHWGCSKGSERRTTYCTELATHGTMCAKHHASDRISSLKCDAKRRLYRKMSGLCYNCGKPTEREVATCDSCYAKHLARARRRGSSRKAKDKTRTAQRRRVKGRVELGLCVRCNRPLVTKTVCAVHRLAAIEYFRKRTGTTQKRPCQRCGSMFHRAVRCEKSLYSDTTDISIEEYATARPGADQMLG